MPRAGVRGIAWRRRYRRNIVGKRTAKRRGGIDSSKAIGVIMCLELECIAEMSF